jgi:uncharacterized protein (DUF608 family)
MEFHFCYKMKSMQENLDGIMHVLLHYPELHQDIIKSFINV